MRSRASAWWLLALAFSCCVSCSQCGDEIVAEIVDAKGDVQRDKHGYAGQFAAAGISDTLHLGDGLRTGPHSEAELKLFPDGVARIEERTLVRFMSERPADGVERLTVEEGVIELDATAVDLELDTGHGIARVRQGSTVRLRANQPDDVQLDVLVGRVQIEREGKQTEAATKGETIALSRPITSDDTATSTADPPIPPSGPADAGVASEPSGDADDNAAVTGAENEGPDVVKQVDVRVTKLENAVIHAATLPLDLALPLEPCAEGATVELGSGRKRRKLAVDAKSNEVSLRAKAGTQKLRIRCGTQTRDLTLRVVRDAATQELPRSAPDVDVAADGRKYTVRYQNLLPSVAFAWPNAEPSTKYVLVVKRGQGREQRFESNKPEKRIKPGELAEGDYTFAFQTANGARSPQSSLRISFDNTARSAYLSSPAENSARAGTIRVAGGALSRSEVSIAGVPVQPDAQGRFEATIPHDASGNAIAVRVSHPSTGVHYYVRRLR